MRVIAKWQVLKHIWQDKDHILTKHQTSIQKKTKYQTEPSHGKRSCNANIWYVDSSLDGIRESCWEIDEENQLDTNNFKWNIGQMDVILLQYLPPKSRNKPISSTPEQGQLTKGGIPFAKIGRTTVRQHSRKHFIKPWVGPTFPEIQTVLNYSFGTSCNLTQNHVSPLDWSHVLHVINFISLLLEQMEFITCKTREQSNGGLQWDWIKIWAESNIMEITTCEQFGF